MGQQDHSVYVQLANNTTQQQAESRLRSLVKKYTPDNTDSSKRDGYIADKNGDYHSLHLLPLTQEHFNPQLGNGSSVSKSFLYTLIFISCVILLIASFNFVNLNVGLSFTRTKEIGIRKCLGAGKKQIWLQVWGESFLMVFASMIIALVAVALLIKTFNKHLIIRWMQVMLFNPLIPGILLMLMIAGLFYCIGLSICYHVQTKNSRNFKRENFRKKPGHVTQCIDRNTVCYSHCINMQHHYYLPAV